MDNSMLIPILAAAIACGSVGLLSVGVMGLLSGGSRVETLRRRLDRAEPGHAVSGDPENISSLPQGLTGLFEIVGDRFGPKDASAQSAAQTALIQAGLRSPNGMAVFHGCKAVLAASLAGIMLFGQTLLAPDLELHWILSLTIFGALLGSYLPQMWLRNRVSARRMSVGDELPDALDLLVVCVESGMGLDQAIHRVSAELDKSSPNISMELTLLTRQLRAGKPRPEAMRDLSDRVGLEDLTSLCTLLIQADLFGISVAQTLRVFSDALRTKRFQRAEEKAAKLPVKLLLPMITCILPALFVAVMGPAGIHLFEIFANLK